MAAETFSLQDYDCIGFDLDHTLIQYKLEELFQLIFQSIAKHLVEKRGYERELLEQDIHEPYLKDFCVKGLAFEAASGNFMKLAEDGYIIRATHGTKPLLDEELVQIYGEKRIWDKYEIMKNTVDNQAAFRCFETYFDTPIGVVAACAIDWLDKKNGKQEDYTSVWVDVMHAAYTNFDPNSFATRTGHFFPGIIDDQENFIRLCSEDLINWLKSLKQAGKILFLLTNSYVDYTHFLLDYAVGQDWKSLFDIVLCTAKKPGFFRGVENLPQFVELDGLTHLEPVKDLQRNSTYTGGNSKDLQKFLCQLAKKEEPRVLYFGDSMRSDIFPTHNFSKWCPVNVIEEMEIEGMVLRNGEVAVFENEDLEHTSPTKRPRKCLTFEDGKDEVLLSEQWGSYFTWDSKDTNDKTAGSKLNTFWSMLLIEHAALAIPRLDFILDLPLDHRFSRFSKAAPLEGFYPGYPKSLQ